MTTEWEPPEDDAEFAAWTDNFLEQLPKYAEQLGITPKELSELKQHHARFRAAFLAEIREQLLVLRGRLKRFCPEDQWPPVFAEAFARLPITREPDRSALLRLLEKWIAGVGRAYGARVRPQLSWRYFAEGIHLEFTVPKPCDFTSVYYRQKGRAAWNFLVMTRGTIKPLYTTPEYLEANEHTDWPGKTLEFIASGCFEDALFGFPSDIIAAVVPTSYPVQLE